MVELTHDSSLTQQGAFGIIVEVVIIGGRIEIAISTRKGPSLQAFVFPDDDRYWMHVQPPSRIDDSGDKKRKTYPMSSHWKLNIKSLSRLGAGNYHLICCQRMLQYKVSFLNTGWAHH
jgi:hypothetical protein